MITDIRNKIIKSKMFKVIIWVTLFALAGVFSLTDIFKKLFHQQGWIVSVNGEKLYTDTFLKRAALQEQLIESFRQQYGDQVAQLYLQMMGLSTNPQQIAYEQSIQELLLNQAAEKLPIAVSDEYSKEKLLDASFLYQHATLVPLYIIEQTGQVNTKALYSFLQRTHSSLSDLQTEVKDAIKRDFLTSLLGTTVYVPNFVLQEEYQEQHARKKFSILTFDFKKVLEQEKKSPVTDQELQQFFDTKNNATKQYQVPEKRTGVMWRFEPNKYGIALNRAEVEAYYDAHKMEKYVEKPVRLQVRRILFAVDPKQNNEAEQRNKAEQTLATVKENPALFGSIAKTESDDKESAAKEGLLDYFSRGTHDRELEKAAFTLGHDQDISSVIKTVKGFEIIQRVGKKPQTFKSLESVAKDIENELVQQRFNKQFIIDMKKNAAEFAKNPEKAEAFFKEKQAKRELLDTSNKKDAKAEKSLFKLTPHSYTHYLDGDIGVVTQLESVQDSYMPALDMIRSTVQDDFYEEKAQKSIAQVVQEAYQRSQKESFDQIKSAYSLQMEKTGLIGPKDTQVLHTLHEKGLPITAMMKMTNPGVMLSHSSGHNGFLVRLDEIEPFNEKEFNEKKSSFSNQAYQQGAQLSLASFVASLYRNATIKTDQSFSNTQE